MSRGNEIYVTKNYIRIILNESERNRRYSQRSIENQPSCLECFFFSQNVVHQKPRTIQVTQTKTEIDLIIIQKLHRQTDYQLKKIKYT